MLLRHSVYTGEGDYRLVEALVSDATGEDPGGHRGRFSELVIRAERLPAAESS